MSEKLFYLGHDRSYFNSLKLELDKALPNHDFDFIIADNTWLKDHQKTYCLLMQAQPSVIFLDFSLPLYFCLELSKLILNDNIGKRISLVALHDYLTKKEVISQSLLSGVRINHIKSGEIFDVVYQALIYFNSDLAKPLKVPLASYNKEVNLLQDLRIAYIHPERIHIETNSILTDGQEITLDGHSIIKNFPSNRFIVRNIRDKFLYFKMRYGIDLKASIYEDESASKSDQKRVYKQIEKWVKQNTGKSIPKKIKVLMVDKTLEIVSQLKKDLSEFPFSINIQSYLFDDLVQIKRMVPHIIAINIIDHPKDQEIGNHWKNVITTTEKGLTKIIDEVKQIREFDPIIVLYNCPVTSEKMQETFGYEKIISYPGLIKLESIQKLALIAEQRVTYDPDDPNKVYFKSSDKDAIIIFNRSVTLVALSESEVYFKAEFPIAMYTVLGLNYPFPMYILVFPHRVGSGHDKEKDCYRGLITCIGETDKKKLRQYVNSILGLDKRERFFSLMGSTHSHISLLQLC